MTAPLDQYLWDLLSQRLGADRLTSLEPGVREQMHADLTSRAQDWLNRALIDAMPDSAMDELNRLIDTDQWEEMQRFMAQQIPNIEQVAGASLAEFGKVYLSK